MNHSIAIIFTMLTFSFQLFAETIIFKTGKSIEGKIVKQSPDSIRVLTGNKETNIPKKQIFKVLYNASAQQKKQLEAQALEASKKEKAVSPEELRALELERIVALEKELEKLNLEKTQTAPRTDEELREKISQLEKRIQDMEKFVEMKSDWKEYYTRKRSPLDLIWRSAIIPGWGQIYAKEGFPGGLYTTLFIMGIVAGEGLSVAHDNANQALQKKIFNTFVTQPVVLNSILTGPAASVSGTSSLIFYQTYTNYNSVLHAMHDAHKLAQERNNAYKFAASVYVFQLLHSAVLGYFWAKKTEVAISPAGELVREGIDIRAYPQFVANLTGTNFNRQAFSELRYTLFLN